MRGLSIFSIVLIYGITIFLDWYISSSIRAYAGRKKLWAGICSVQSVLCLALVSTLVVCVFSRREGSLHLLMWFLFIYFSIYIPKFVYFLISGISRLIGKYIKTGDCNRDGKCRSIGKKGTIAGGIIAVLVCIAMWSGIFYTRNHIEIKNVEFKSDRIPAEFDGYKIVQFSDAHVGTWGNDTVFIGEMVDKINGLNPDLIVFTGDVVSRTTDELLPFRNVLSRLKARDGVVSVLGNHDYGDYVNWSSEQEHVANNEQLAALQKGMGWDLLKNEYRYIHSENDSIVIIGVENWGEPPFPQYGKLKESYSPSGNAESDLNDGNFKILLSHNPEHWNQEVTEISNVDLTLSGHTHAMQTGIRIGNFNWSPAIWRYPLWGGMYERESKDGHKQHLYVNIGCGEVGVPARFGSAYPEITEIILKADK